MLSALTPRCYEMNIGAMPQIYCQLWLHAKNVLALALFTALGLITVQPTQAAGTCQEIAGQEIAGNPDNGAQNSQSFYSASYALIIGMDKYTSGWRPLSNAVADARKVAQTMAARGFQVQLCENLDHDRLIQSLRDFFIVKGEEKDARLFVWFAGHGHTENRQGYLIPTDSPLPEVGAQFRLKAVPMGTVKTLVSQAISKHVFVVFDACFAGTIFASSRSHTPPAVSLAAAQPVRQFLTSGDQYQKVPDDGRFRKLFLRALVGEEAADANQDGFLTGTEMSAYLADRVTNLTNSAQTPRYGKLRDEDYDRGEFIFTTLSGGGGSSSSDSSTSSPSSAFRAALPVIPPAPPADPKIELAFWQAVSTSKDPLEYEIYLQEFPNGAFQSLARRRIESFQPPPITCVTDEEVMRGPIEKSFKALERKENNLYVGYYDEAVIQYLPKGRTRTMGGIYNTISNLINSLDSVKVESMNTIFLGRKRDRASFTHTYTLSLKYRDGRVERREDVNELYVVKCQEKTGRWFIISQRNLSAEE